MHCGSHTTKCRILAALLLAAQPLLSWQNPPVDAPKTDAPLSDRDLTARKTGSQASKNIPRGYALIIGISKYQRIDPAQNLEFPESDAQSIYRAIISKDVGAFAPENVHVLIGPQATKANIHRELEEWLPSVAGENNTIFVFFAGHGLSVNGLGYFAPWDIDPEHIPETGYPMSDFGRVLETKVKATNKVLFVDACRSGKVSRGLTDSAADSAVVNAQLGKLSNSFLTFVAAREQDKSFEDRNLGNGAGLFSYFVLRALEGDADTNCDGYVTADELIEYVRTSVRQYARNHGESQTPTDYGDFEPKLVLALSHRCGSSAPTETANIGDLVVEGNMDGIDVYLDDKPVGSVSPGKPLRLSGIAGGIHSVMGVRKGYEKDTKQATVIPGQAHSVSIRIQYAREYKKQSRLYMEQGEKLLFTHHSSFNPSAVYAPTSQGAKSFEHAEDLFDKSLKDDPQNARAAYDLGLTFLYLDHEAQSLDMLRKAVTLDPTYTEARTQYAGELIESGDPDEAVRQLTDVLRVEPDNDMACSYLARAYYDKGVFDKSLEAAERAITLRQANEQAHLWKGAALRMIAVQTKDGTPKQQYYQKSCDAFKSFLQLTNFSAPAYAQILFYLSPLPSIGYRSHTDRAESYKLQRGIALEGLCDAENKLGHSIQAGNYCTEAIRDDPKDPVAYYLMGHVHRDQFGRTHSKRELLLARDNYQKVVDLNPDLDISRNSRNYLDQIQALLERLSAMSKPQ
jgi:tetratricopeptide (TPR) repeat protein